VARWGSLGSHCLQQDEGGCGSAAEGRRDTWYLACHLQATSSMPALNLGACRPARVITLRHGPPPCS
jgi:hypothetical protein